MEIHPFFFRLFARGASLATFWRTQISASVFFEGGPGALRVGHLSIIA
jgi:hypothetical protein